jgi:hypothetical protein
MSSLVANALRIARVEPSMGEEAKNGQLDRLTEKQLEWLTELDRDYYAAVDQYMEKCRAFAERERLL